MVDCETGYVHVLDGRMRIKVAEIKRSPDAARRTEVTLRGLAGITGVTANPASGNVLVLFEPEDATADDIVGAIRALGYLRRPGKLRRVTQVPQSNFARKVMQEVAVATCAGLIKVGFRAAVAALA
jgi:hypothetical protein